MQAVIDVAGFLGDWPFRRIPRSSREHLHTLAGECGLERVVVSSFENLFWENAADAALATAESTARDKLLVHFPMANAAFPSVVDNLMRLHDEHPFAGVRLLSNYHGYSLDGACVDDLLAWTQAERLTVQVFRRIVDERLHYILKVPHVEEDELVRLAERHPEQRFIYSGLGYGEIVSVAEATGCPKHVWFDTSRCRGPERWPQKLVEKVPPDRIVFGSLWPLQVIRSTLQELRFAPLDETTRAMILHDNAAALIGR
ncbi:MAG: amidohydrolase family protein [Phycisphaerae bacterium]|nr:amidohydrolase family protein [Phycisphaerae bacterium]